MKKFVSICLSFAFLMALTPVSMGIDATESPDATEVVPVVETEPSVKEEVAQEEFEQAYQNIMTYAEEYDIPLEMALEDFVDEYYQNDSYQDIESYENAYYELLDTGEMEVYADEGDNNSETGSAGGKWYYDTGMSLPQTANYNTYNLLSTVQKGDIIFESKGGFGITGHIAIV